MIDFTKCLEKGEVCVCTCCESEISCDDFLHRLAMGENNIPIGGGDYWEFTFEGFDSVTEEIGEDERFARVGKISLEDIIKNSDGSCSLMLPIGFWENKRMFRANKSEYAICVPLDIRFTPGKENSWDIMKSVLQALILAEDIRSKKEKVLSFEELANGNTLVKAMDKTQAEVNSIVAKKAKEIIEEFGIQVVSLDIDHITCAHGEISDLNLHVDNPEVLDNEAFKEKSKALTIFADKYDWDVWFVRPGHARNAFIESLTAL